MMKLFGWLCAAATLFCGATLGVWIQDRYLPVYSTPVEVVGSAHPGSPLLIRWKVQRTRACAAAKSELIIDTKTVRWVLPSLSFPTPPGPMGDSTFVSQSQIPPEIPIGPATLWVTLAYTCNPVHLIWPITDYIPGIKVVFSPKT